MTESQDVAWMARAACRGSFPGQLTHIFFPEEGGNYDAAKAVCAECPVRAECLAVGNAQPRGGEGMFGGSTPSMRRRTADRRPQKQLVHGTESGYILHRYRQLLPICDSCKAAHSTATASRLRRAQMKRMEAAS
jgi:WhiB family redox-sensing transcriptional regulator